MQAILTKYIPATNKRGSRIKAECERGSVVIGYPHELSGDEVHREAVRQLVAKFNKEDKLKYGSQQSGWNLPFVTGQLKNGNYVHVFVRN